MALGEQAHHDEIDDLTLSLDDALDVAGDGVELLGEPVQVLLGAGSRGQVVTSLEIESRAYQ
jgi:hypothetical protein